jgi:hypothetical protein
MTTRRSNDRRSLVAALAIGLALLLPLRSAAEKSEGGSEDRLAHSLSLFRELSRTPVIMEAEHGWLRSVDFSIPLAKPTGEPVADALAFLETYADALAIPAPRRTLHLARVVRSEIGTSVFFDQHFDGVSVYGAQVAVHLQDGVARGVGGSWLSQAPPRMHPAIDRTRATEIARESAGDGSAIAGTPRLVHYDPELVGAVSKEGLTRSGTLAWSVTAVGGSGGGYLAIDAMTGETLSRSPMEHTLDYDIQTAHLSDQSLFCLVPGATTWFDERGRISGTTPDSEGFAADASLRATYDFFLAQGRDGWNGTGGYMRLTLDRGLGYFFGTPNASFNDRCNTLTFTDNESHRDVLAHEFSHGVVQYSAGLLPTPRFGPLLEPIFPPAVQSDSLNEHYADVFAVIVDPANWTLGETTPSGLTRDLSNPGNPNAASRGPDRMSLITTSLSPHRNANIMNKAAFLIGNGQTFNGIAVTGIGRPKLARLYFTTLVTGLAPTATFQTAANATMRIARDFAAAGMFGFTAADACSVSRAFTAIELDGDFDCDGLPDSMDDDADFDGVANGVDNCPAVSNPGQRNTDAGTGDTLGDACDTDLDGDGVDNGPDNCRFASNPSQSDWNGDGTGDACGDVDFDGVVDGDDNCRFEPNPNRRDLDLDGVGDACDVDADGDGVANQVDNCPRKENPSQADSDGDGAGNSCDLCPAAADTGVDTDSDGIDDACDPDDDNDGIVDRDDNCPLEPNADQADFNGDGVGAACDPKEMVQMSLDGSRTALDTVFQTQRSKLFRQTIPLTCSAEGVPLAFGGGEEALDVRFESSAPIGVAIVDRSGAQLASLPPATSGKLQLPVARDLCPLPSEDGELAALGAETLSLELQLAEPVPRFEFSMDAGVVPFEPARGEPMEK